MLLVDNKKRRHLITLVAGGQFHTHAGIVEHDEHHRQRRRHHGAHDRAARACIAVRPTLSEYVLEMPRGAQVIYPKDLGPILMLADIFPGARILESGVGSGALDDVRSCARPAEGRVTGYEIRDDFADRAQQNVHGFLGADVPLDVEVRDVYEGIDEHDLDRVVLDLPEPWRVGEARGQASLRPGGILVAYLPDDPAGRAAARGARATRRSAWSRRSRCCSARWHVEGQSIRPDHRMVAHTGFLTHARLLVPTPERGMNVLDIVDHRGASLAAGVGGWRLGFVARVFAWAGVALGLVIGVALRAATSSPRSAGPAPTTASRSRCSSSCWSRRSVRRSVSASA